MKRRLEQLQRSGVSLIEIIAVIAIAFIVSASIQIVSNGRAAPNPLHRDSVTTNQLGRELHAPSHGIHTYAPRR